MDIWDRKLAAPNVRTLRTSAGRKTGAYTAERGLAFVVLLLAALGQIAIAGLLMCQAYTLDKKRKQRNGFSDT